MPVVEEAKDGWDWDEMAGLGGGELTNGLLVWRVDGGGVRWKVRSLLSMGVIGGWKSVIGSTGWSGRRLVDLGA